jgi:hypothetical protein
MATGAAHNSQYGGGGVSSGVLPPPSSSQLIFNDGSNGGEQQQSGQKLTAPSIYQRQNQFTVHRRRAWEEEKAKLDVLHARNGVTAQHVSIIYTKKKEEEERVFVIYS